MNVLENYTTLKTAKIIIQKVIEGLFLMNCVPIFFHYLKTGKELKKIKFLKHLKSQNQNI